MELWRKHIRSSWTLEFSLDFSVGETLEVASGQGPRQRPELIQGTMTVDAQPQTRCPQGAGTGAAAAID